MPDYYDNTNIKNLNMKKLILNWLFGTDINSYMDLLRENMNYTNMNKLYIYLLKIKILN